MKRLVLGISGLMLLSTFSHAITTENREKVFPVNMEILRSCPDKTQLKGSYEIVVRNIAKLNRYINTLSSSDSSALVKLQASEPLIRKSITFELIESDNLKNHEVQNYLLKAKEQINRCKEIKFLLSNF
jgi:hypothetical protein